MRNNLYGTMANFRRIDREMAKKIQAYRQKLLAAGIDEDEVYFATLIKFDATALEHTWGIFWYWIGRKRPDEPILALYHKMYTQKKRLFNKSESNPDEQAIGVPIPVQKQTGRRGYMWIDKIAHGAQALVMAAWCKKPRDGYNHKIETLEDIGKDQALYRRHMAKFREIEKRANSNSKGGAGII